MGQNFKEVMEARTEVWPARVITLLQVLSEATEEVVTAREVEVGVEVVNTEAEEVKVVQPVLLMEEPEAEVARTMQRVLRSLQNLDQVPTQGACLVLIGGARQESQELQ
jgi:hypothetical protein